MFRILIISHGHTAQSMKELSSMMYGDVPEVAALCLYESVGPDQFRQQIIESVQAHEEDLLILCDLAGGSPMIASVYAKRELEGVRNIRIVSGVNAPMLLELIGQRHSLDLEHAVELAVDIGRLGIKEIAIGKEGSHS